MNNAGNTSAKAIYDFSNLFPIINEDLLEQMKKESEEEWIQNLLLEWTRRFEKWLNKHNQKLTISNHNLTELLEGNLFPYLQVALYMHICIKYTIDGSFFNPILANKSAVNVRQILNALKEQAETKQPIDIETASQDMYDFLLKCSDHIDIATRMGLDKYELGLYDALVGVFCENFDPRLLDVAHQLGLWLPTQQYLRDKAEDEKKQILSEKLNELTERYATAIDNEELTCAYLINDIIPEWDRAGISIIPRKK